MTSALRLYFTGSLWFSLSATSFCHSEIKDASDTCISSFRRLGTPGLREHPVLHGRESIPDSHMSWMPRFGNEARENFPAAFQFVGHAGDLTAASTGFDELLNLSLSEFGAIVVKGLPVRSPKDFSALMHSTNMTLVDYVAGVTPRPSIAPKVSIASGESADVSMELHSDDPWWPVPPSRLILYMQVKPRKGGQALISDGRAVLRQLKETYPEVVSEFQHRSLRYEHFYPDKYADTGRPGVILSSWQEAFAKDCVVGDGCNATEVAEITLHKMHESDSGFEWLPGGGLKRWEVANPVVPHPVTGELTWTNQITAMHCSIFDNHPTYPELNRPPEARSQPCSMHGTMPYHTSFVDGGTIPVSFLHTIRKVQWANAVSFDFEDGDILAIDNYYVQHGRFSFEPPRELFLTLVVP